MIRITVYHLAVKIELETTHLKSRIDRFIQKYYTSKGLAVNANTPGVDKEFVSRVGNNAYVMHTNQFIHFLHYLKEMGETLGEVQRIDATQYNIVRENYEVRDEWTLRDYQEPICKFLIENPVKSKMVILQTGKGKSLVSMYALAKIGMRIGVCVLPMYMEDWLKHAVKIHKAKTHEVMMVSGSKAVRALIAMARDNELTARYYIFSKDTIQDFITAYEQNPEHCVLMYGGGDWVIGDR